MRQETLTARLHPGSMLMEPNQILKSQLFLNETRHAPVVKDAAAPAVSWCERPGPQAAMLDPVQGPGMIPRLVRNALSNSADW